jgi:hypothetical protein
MGAKISVFLREIPQKKNNFLGEGKFPLVVWWLQDLSGNRMKILTAVLIGCGKAFNVR